MVLKGKQPSNMKTLKIKKNKIVLASNSTENKGHFGHRIKVTQQHKSTQRKLCINL